MTQTLMPFIWVIITLLVLLLLQRWIHMHLGGLALLVTGAKERAVIFYAIILLPGVLLHELSHWVMASLLGVRTGSFSLMPRIQQDGTVQLGYVEYYKGSNLGPIRESLIGGAPLIFGTSVILLIGFHIFGVTDLATAVQTGEITLLTEALTQLLTTNDFLVWLYLLFAISNAMLPSPSDRRAWPAFIWIMVAIAIILYLLGLQQVVINELVGPATVVFGYLGTAFSMAIGVDLFFMAMIALLENVIGALKGRSVNYGR